LTGAFALVGWLALASASTINGSAGGYQSLAGVQLAQMEPAQSHPWPQKHEGDDEWYQGQRGHWYKDHDRWVWRGAEGDQWYMGQRGHWYREKRGWQFGSDGLVCNDRGRDCRRGGYLPPNGEGMVNRGDPNMFWACDPQGHHCHWARRLL
ncbi:MAG: hypothetical protein JOZ29_00215, partial [Deltaproteobacteria bacterium]|nr:hypothetical protein [Deltaproteobacteria bacterium]